MLVSKNSSSKLLLCLCPNYYFKKEKWILDHKGKVNLKAVVYSATSAEGRAVQMHSVYTAVDCGCGLWLWTVAVDCVHGLCPWTVPLDCAHGLCLVPFDHPSFIKQGRKAPCALYKSRNHHNYSLSLNTVHIREVQKVSSKLHS